MKNSPLDAFFSNVESDSYRHDSKDDNCFICNLLLHKLQYQYKYSVGGWAKLVVKGGYSPLFPTSLWTSPSVTVVYIHYSVRTQVRLIYLAMASTPLFVVLRCSLPASLCTCTWTCGNVHSYPVLEWDCTRQSAIWYAHLCLQWISDELRAYYSKSVQLLYGFNTHHLDGKSAMNNIHIQCSFEILIVITTLWQKNYTASCDCSSFQ